MPKESTLQKITPEELPALIRGLKKQQINELALVGPDFWLAESPENWPNELQGRRVFRLTIRPERLPDELTQHQKWEALILRGLGLRDEDAEILSNHFKNLTRLDLRDNQIGTAGVTAIVQLQNLQTLWLGKNQISELPGVIGQLKNLQKLWLDNNQISELPEVIGQLKNLQSLRLGNNQFSELPEVIGQLKNLQKLWLDNNQISELPEVIGQLKNLQSLRLGNNQISELPEVIGQLKNLQSLSLDNNQISELPEVIGQLKNLQKLWLDNNQISELPEVIGQLKNLEELDLDNNQISELPEVISQLKNLQKLWLHNNQISELPEVIGQLQNLQKLWLGKNQISELPEVIGQLKNLQSLGFHSSQISELPEVIGQLKNLQSLSLGNNQFSELPEVIGQLTNLRELWLHNNPISELPEVIGQLKNLQTLWLDNNQISELPEVIGQLKNLQFLILDNNQISELPEVIGQLKNLQSLRLGNNQISELPEVIGQLKNLQSLSLGNNQFSELPEVVGQLKNLRELWLDNNQISELPEVIGQLKNLQSLSLHNNQISELPEVIGQLKNLQSLSLDENPLIPELAAAYSQGTKVLLAYLQARDAAPITLNETKLILVGEGEVGKTSLLASLRGEKFIEKRATTHGVEVDVKSLVVANPGTNTEISLNGWDFGGQNIYRHTHQLFFTAPAVYLAVWEPRRGPEQCRVQEWIKMIKHRAYDETRPAEKPRILVVATHGGPKERLAHIDEQALKDEFGELIRGFYHVDSKPGPDGVCYNLETLKTAIAAEAAAIPSVGRTVPQSWKEVLEAVRARSEKEPYIYFSDFESICEEKGVSKSLAETYAIIMNELGHLIYFRDDEILKNTVILKPDYLSKAVSFILEDDQTRNAHGLIEHPRLGTLWNNPDRPAGERYPAHLHPIFLRLMNRFDLSYQVSMPQAESPPTSLMAQLVPSIRPEGWQEAWGQNTGDAERTQVCRILDATTGRTVEAEGLMYRLIVRLHRYSLGRDNYHLSRHWKTGMVLDDGYNGRAFIEEIDGDIYVNVRAAYPERFLAHLCAEVQWLVEHFWKGLDARLYVPCPGESCKGLLELGEIMDFKSNGIPKVRCGVCRQFHDIDGLMTSQKPRPDWQEAMMELREGQREILQAHQVGFDQLSTQLKVLMSQADEQYAKLLAWLSDPAKDGPRLFSLLPVTRSKFNPREWTSEKFHLLLWCEHSKLPVSFWHGPKSRQGIIEIELKRDWFERAAPFLKVLTSTLSLVLPVASATVKLSMADEDYKSISNQLEFTQKFIDSSLKGAEKFNEWLDRGDNFSRPNEPEEVDDLTPAGGSALRELHALLREKDPGFGGLVRVQNKRHEFLWVHERFAGEY